MPLVQHKSVQILATVRWKAPFHFAYFFFEGNEMHSENRPSTDFLVR